MPENVPYIHKPYKLFQIFFSTLYFRGEIILAVSQMFRYYFRRGLSESVLEARKFPLQVIFNSILILNIKIHPAWRNILKENALFHATQRTNCVSCFVLGVRMSRKAILIGFVFLHSTYGYSIWISMCGNPFGLALALHARSVATSTNFSPKYPEMATFLAFFYQIFASIN